MKRKNFCILVKSLPSTFLSSFYHRGCSSVNQQRSGLMISLQELFIFTPLSSIISTTTTTIVGEVNWKIFLFFVPSGVKRRKRLFTCIYYIYISSEPGRVGGDGVAAAAIAQVGKNNDLPSTTSETCTP